MYRVGQSASRRFVARGLPLSTVQAATSRLPDVEPGLVAGLAALSDQQRTVVLLVHALDWSQAEVASLLDINPSTVREHLQRALDRLREHLEVHDAH